MIERDLATSAEVLRLVNSSFFGLPVRVDSVARAVTLLGPWGFGEAVVEAIAGRPATPADPAATPAAQLLTLARWRAMAPAGTSLPVRAVADGYLTQGRLDRWNQVCDVVMAAAGADTVPAVEVAATPA